MLLIDGRAEANTQIQIQPAITTGPSAVGSHEERGPAEGIGTGTSREQVNDRRGNSGGAWTIKTRSAPRFIRQDESRIFGAFNRLQI
jgi:hypothetical protein